MKRYEGMFLFDSAGARDWAAIDQEVRRLLGRISAEPLVCVKFDERKLAYEIKRRKRGTYVLTYFKHNGLRAGGPTRRRPLRCQGRAARSLLPAQHARAGFPIIMLRHLAATPR